MLILVSTPWSKGKIDGSSFKWHMWSLPMGLLPCVIMNLFYICLFLFSRNSTMRESTAQDPASPMPVSGEGEAHSGVVDALSTMSSSQLSSTMSPTAKPGH